MLDLLEGQQLITSTLTDDTDKWDLLVLTGDEFLHIGKAIQDIVIDVEVRDLLAQFEFYVAIQRRFKDGDWTPTVASMASGDCLVGSPSSPVGANGYTVGSAFTDRTRFGFASRLVLCHHSKSTGGGRVGASARLNLSAAVRFWGD